MSTPIIGRNAVIKMGAVAIGYGVGITASISADILKQYVFQSDKASILASGNKSFKVGCDKLYIDNTYASAVLGGTAVDFEIAPAGTTTGKPKITIKNVVLNLWDFRADQNGIVAEKVTGEGNDFQTGTY